MIFERHTACPLYKKVTGTSDKYKLNIQVHGEGIDFSPIRILQKKQLKEEYDLFLYVKCWQLSQMITGTKHSF